jgi:hypothetical protein
MAEPFWTWPWKRDVLPSIYMPRYACRITPIVKDVRVERVQDISQNDALAEGIIKMYDNASWTYGWEGMPMPAFYGKPQWAFRALWDSINVERGLGWDVNSWVWVIEHDYT